MSYFYNYEKAQKVLNFAFNQWAKAIRAEAPWRGTQRSSRAAGRGWLPPSGRGGVPGSCPGLRTLLCAEPSEEPVLAVCAPMTGITLGKPSAPINHEVRTPIPERNSGRGEMRGCPDGDVRRRRRGPPSGRPRPARQAAQGAPAQQPTQVLAATCSPQPGRFAVLRPCLTITTLLRQWFAHHLQYQSPQA